MEKEKEFRLSDRMHKIQHSYSEKDVKEFVERLKDIDFAERIIKPEYAAMKAVFNTNICLKIDELTGDL